MKHCFFFLWDGARYDLFKKFLSEGSLPNIQKYLLKRGELQKALSTFPSTTGPAYLPFLTGKTPGECNIPGIRWFDKNFLDGEKRLRHRSYVGLESRFLNSDLSPHVTTIFECIPRSFNLYNPIDRGILKGRSKARKLGGVYGAINHFAASTWIDKKIKKRFLKILEDKPQFVFCVFPGIDFVSHVSKLDSQKVKEAYRVADECFGEVIEKHIVQNDPHFENTLLIVSSDHGMSETHTHFDVATHLKKQGNKVFSYPHVWKKKCEVAVMVSGNAMAHLYFTNEKNILTAQKIKDDHQKLIDDLLLNEAIDWIALRRDPGFKVFHQQGSSHFYNDHYEWEGFDKFQIGKNEISESESLKKTFEGPYPNILNELSQIFISERSGDLIVCAKKGFDLRKAFEIPEHTSSHGGLIPEHMHIPLCSNKKIFNDYPRSIDIYSHILSYLDI